jgi:hypothetical protein
VDKKSSGVVLSFPASEFRALPIPFESNTEGNKLKLGSCFVNAGDIPTELTQWMRVNPRVPVLNHKQELKGRVAKAMLETLLYEPELFALKNQGIWLLASKVDFSKSSGGTGVVEVTLKDPERHGLVNGGHTAHAILQAQEMRDPNEPWPAYVRLHVLEGVDVEWVTELAEGLNTSMQVDDPSLQNLAGAFSGIKEAMVGKLGEDAIAYRQGDPGDIDVRQVLTMMALFNLDEYDRKRHPNLLFGQKKGVLEAFVKDSAEPDSIFKKILPKLPEILILADHIQQLAFERCGKSISKVKLTDAETNNRAGSAKYKSIPAYFAGGFIGGKFPLGWLYPAVAAFRANVSKADWDKGHFKWIVKPSKLLPGVIEDLIEIILTEHQDNKRKPGEVGRREAAYRLCYSSVAMALAEQGKLGV